MTESTPPPFGTPPPVPPPPGIPYPPPYVDPTAPYGRDPANGAPYSDKSKLVAGLLQLLGLVGFLGFGRIYLGQTLLGVVQLLVGWATFGVGALIWGIIDAVLIFGGKVSDKAGRQLRD
ncbi:NINE protein [Mycobacteroides salmoniphilum]|uniref:TM2 domain protein n=1 Tax=Mycobacteroides salmoniphilum TaxID=404941 RepID=A0A4R8SP96_9MYCO|nr:NINE protein [Mycobacteroides salmoniphilum]TDZ90782.1 TM2 domain protein [Mycobacteroides salmoniphilum]TEA00700.1 TM2 domain protein [Mycobacteroides salmoniphilum]